MRHKWTGTQWAAQCTKCGCYRKLEKKSGGYRTSYGFMPAGAGASNRVDWSRACPDCDSEGPGKTAV